jgi:hypothetical protein
MMDYATDVAESCWMYGLTMKQLKQLNQGEHMTWPFPPASGAVPWTKQQEKAYQQQKQEQRPSAPF